MSSWSLGKIVAPADPPTHRSQDLNEMALTLTDEARKQALASITRFCTDELELEANTVQSTLLLKFFLAELGPTIYNTGVADAQAFLRDRLADLEATCYEPEFVYWPKESSVRRKR